MTSSLVGSEMCIRDRIMREWHGTDGEMDVCSDGVARAAVRATPGDAFLCLLYTSDAADDM
eukprot:9254398-Prorocentrum_lima.AAC.1